MPKAVILENVSSLLHKPHRRTFNLMWELLQSMDEYEWQHKVLNTKDFGVPQNCPRVFIVGILKSCKQRAFNWPQHSTAISIDAFLDRQAGIVDLTRLPPAGSQARRKVVRSLTRLIEKGIHPLRTAAVCACDNRRSVMMIGAAPCLTASRAKTGGHWLLHRARKMSSDEMFRLQGLRPERWELPPGVKPSHMQFCVGNAISGNVIRLILCKVLAALGRI